MTEPQTSFEYRPASVSHLYLNLVAIVAAALTLVWSFTFRPGDGAFAAVAAGSVLFFVIASGEAWILRGRGRPSSGLAQRRLRRVSVATTLQRYVGLLTTLAACGALYWLFPEYRDPFYSPYWRFLRLLSFVIFLAPLYFFWAGERQIDEEDAYLQLGRYALTLGRTPLNPKTLRLHVTGWAIKAFFLPVMVSYFSETAAYAISFWHHLSVDELSIYRFGMNLTLSIDLLISLVGYTLTLRVLDTQIRSTDPTLLGWLVTLICYRPIYSLLMGNAYLNFQSGISWETAIAGHPVLGTVWFLAIMAMFVLHSTAMACFGLRFSNLTHRGIITNGPYRFTKHPHYIAKNLSWWLIWIPFVPHSGWAEALRHSCLLLLCNGVYYLRAKTEERHLMRDSVYVAYCAWIEQHGLFRAWWRKRIAPVKAEVGLA